MNFTASERKTFEKYLPSDLKIRWESMSSVDFSEKVKVTNTGMVNSGKSSLFNVLIDSQTEYFKTGPVRTTATADTYDMGDYQFVDTPGIDVNDQDDALAYSTIMSSDLILMIHNIKTGPLQRKEVEWLEKIVANINNPEAVQKRLIFVISWKDSRERDSDYEDMVNSLKKMVFDVCQVKIPVFEISVKKYKAGQEKNSQKLIESSNVLPLKQYITDYVAEYQRERVHLHHISYSALANEIKKKLLAEKIQLQKKTRNNQENVRTIYKGKRSIWNNMFEYYKQQEQALREI